MTATSWGDLFDRSASYGVDLERIRAVDDDLDDAAAADADGTETEAEEDDDGA
ncbi:hypothetical protein [Halopiger aswanensis]|uniref:Uncharacterized protein n=1 Tax=Halopiger aswanensis TaxID=148449 RepID=A0A3R7GLY2_9EURY|nr:hypothetical protein [Halopiger aswanensis]RKD98314.1 hypothetical protein ATJ93_1320 [Halopiger aswanensis]